MRVREFLSLFTGTFLLYFSMTCYQKQINLHDKPDIPKSENSNLVANQENENVSKPAAGLEQIHLTANVARSLPKNELEQGNLVIKREVLLPGQSPSFMRGIYISNSTIRNSELIKTHISEALQNGVNTMVIDVQPRMPAREVISALKLAGIYTVARVVVFPDGLKTKMPSSGHAEKISDLIGDCAYQGFSEVQLDYIRYADEPELQKLPLQFKYNVIEEFLANMRERANKEKIRLSADVFGRITLNNNDHIGQKLENFAAYTDALYPMVYPSHYHNDKKRMSDPYFTVKEGVQSSKERVKDTAIIAYIQGFQMSVKLSKLTMAEYIKAQMKAVKDAGGDGWVIWNPYNRYAEAYAAMRSLAEESRVAARP